MRRLNDNNNNNFEKNDFAIIRQSYKYSCHNYKVKSWFIYTLTAHLLSLYTILNTKKSKAKTMPRPEQTHIGRYTWSGNETSVGITILESFGIMPSERQDIGNQECRIVNYVETRTC